MAVRTQGRARRWTPAPVWPRGWWPDIAVVAGLVLVTASLAVAPIRNPDLAIRDIGDSYRPHGVETAVLWVNRLGSGGILTGIALAVAVGVAWHRRSPWPIAPVLAAFFLTGLSIQPLKIFLHRAAPHSPLPDDVETRLFSQADGLSYPSGHAVNTIVWYGVLCLLLAPWLAPAVRRWIRWVPPIIVTFTATYLGHHWLTDMIAGLCLGILIDRVLARVPWPALAPSRSPREA